MKVAMISGGGRGLGAAITERLLADGWTVSLGLRDTSQAERFGTERVMAAHFDATDPATAQPWVDATVAGYGRIDALINNAGILGSWISRRGPRMISTTSGRSTSRRRSA
jgi:NAD(P)-dependent dehydrogenase (short-subunit alcohol dehydrogenase family)